MSTAVIPKVSWHPTRLFQRLTVWQAGLSWVNVQDRGHTGWLHRCENRIISVFSLKRKNMKLEKYDLFQEGNQF